MAKKKDQSQEDLDEESIIELIDDNNNVIKFRLFDVTEYKGEKYALLLPAEHNDAVGDDEVAIFRYNEEEQMLETIEDEALMEEVFAFYQQESDEDDGGDDGEE